MTRFWVLEPAGSAGPSERARLVPDRFRWAALPLPALWLAVNRAWIAALLALLVDAALFAAMRQGALADAAVWLAILFRLAVALEGPRLVASAYRRRGWREADVVHADSRQGADAFYFASGPVVAVPDEDELTPAISGTARPWWHRDGGDETQTESRA